MMVSNYDNDRKHAWGVDIMNMDTVLKILEKQTLMSVATQGVTYPDNSVVCFAYDELCNLYFGSYSDTLKCKNITNYPSIAVTVGSLQIHGIATIVTYGTDDYYEGREIYDNRFPQYRNLFELEHNELYIIKPLVIWNYSPFKGEMHRDVIVFDEKYYNSIDVYLPHVYSIRT